MKYYLAIDKGPHEIISQRYLKLKLSEIDKKLGYSALNQENNFKNLLKFTMTFNNKRQLKDFLKSLGLISQPYQNHELIIYYERNYQNKTYYRSLKIPYRCHEKYFNFESLATIIKKRSLANPNYLKNFLLNLPQNYNSEEFYLLRDFSNNIWSEGILYDRLRAFLKSACYSSKTSALNTRNLYDLAMLAATFDNVTPSLNNNTPKTSRLSEAEQAKLEELEDRANRLNDDQLSLF